MRGVLSKLDEVLSKIQFFLKLISDRFSGFALNQNHPQSFETQGQIQPIAKLIFKYKSEQFLWENNRKSRLK